MSEEFDKQLNSLVSHIKQLSQEWVHDTLTQLDEKACEIHESYRQARKHLNEESSSSEEDSDSEEDSVAEPVKKKAWTIRSLFPCASCGSDKAWNDCNECSKALCHKCVDTLDEKLKVSPGEIYCSLACYLEAYPTNHEQCFKACLHELQQTTCRITMSLNLYPHNHEIWKAHKYSVHLYRNRDPEVKVPG